MCVSLCPGCLVLAQKSEHTISVVTVNEGRGLESEGSGSESGFSPYSTVC